jgi:hypothetical protein
MRKIVASLGVLITLALDAKAQELTLRERAIQATDEVNLGIGIEGASPSVEQLIAEADLVVQGKIQSSTSYLSSDGKLIWSDYPIGLVHIFLGNLRLRARPNVVSEIVVTHIGGELQLEGKRVRVHDMRLPALPVGSEVVLLLKQREDGKYEIVEGGFGAFRVENGLLQAVVRKVGKHREMDGASLAEFASKVGSKSREHGPGE